MSGWHTVLQEASFKGVRFDVDRIDEHNGKALAEHAQPFVSGVDLEDMGNSGREINISAVFYGKQYSSRLLKLLDALEESGACVLVHPIWGRMQNMMPVSWNYRHEADNVDFSAVDISFREATEAQPILVFENEFLIELERLIAQIDAYRSFAEGFIDAVLAVKGGVSDLWGSALGLYSGLAGSFAAVRSLFEFDAAAWLFGSAAYREDDFQTAMRAGVANLADMVAEGLQRESANGSAIDAASGGLTVRQRFDEAATLADKVCAVPATLHGSQSETRSGFAGLQRITSKQMQPTQMAINAVVLAALVDIATALIEEHGEEMGAPDLMRINHSVRTRIQANIEELRAVEKQAFTEHSMAAEAVCSTAYQAAESLRGIAGRFNALVVAAINQKPPLTVRMAPFDGTVHQIAFALYGDITRAGELIRLNPHINHPAFIRRNDLINAYAK